MELEYRLKLEKDDKYLENDNVQYLNTKIKFLDDNYEKISTITTYWNVFKKYILPVEKEMGKDIYNFTSAEIKDFIESVPTTSLRVKASLSRLASLYIDYCIKILMLRQGTNPFDNLDIAELTKISKKSITTEYITLSNFLEMCSDAKTKGCPAQIIIVPLLSRLGIYGEDLLELRIDDIDRKKNIIYLVDHLSGEILREVIINDDKVYEFIDNAIEEYTLVRKYREGNHKVRDTQLYDADNRVLKSASVKNQRLEANSMFAFIKEFFTVLGEQSLSPKKLVRCKMFDELNARAKNNLLTTVDFQQVMHKYYPTSAKSSYFNMQKDFELCFPDIEIQK